MDDLWMRQSTGQRQLVQEMKVEAKTL